MRRVAGWFIGVLVAASLAAQSTNNSLEAARLNNRGAAYMNQQLFDKALADFQRASSLNPNLKIARMNEGIALLNMGKIEAAKPLLEDSVKSLADDPHAWYNLGLLYKNSGDDEKAIAAFERVTKIDPADPDAWYFLGASYVQAKQPNKAIPAFEQALNLNPLHASAQFGLARAYQQQKDEAAAREHLQRFQYITLHKLSAPISLAYGEQGKHSLAEESPLAPQKVPAAIKVKFVDVTSKSGLGNQPVRPARALATLPGSGACVFDYDNDGRPDILLLAGSAQGGIQLLHNVAEWRFDDVTEATGLNPKLTAVGCAVGDYDNDGRADIAISLGNGLELLHNDKNGKFQNVTKTAGITTEGDVHRVMFIDYDHDGDLDLYITQHKDVGEELVPQGSIFAPKTAEKAIPLEQNTPDNAMWRNNGDGTFTDVTVATGLWAPDSFASTAATDYNNDRAIDIVASGDSNLILENPREGKFIPRYLIPHERAIAILVLDFDHDGWMDLALSMWQKGWTLLRNVEGKSFDKVPLAEAGIPKSLWGLAAFDFDNDGWVDIATVGETENGG